MSEPVVTNDLKGIGPFILASIEIEQAASDAARAPGAATSDRTDR
jgi:hypothetical protein